MITTIAELLQLVSRLEVAHIYFTLERNRHDAITIQAVVPGQRWEIDILADGEVAIEVFRSDGTIHQEPKLEALFRQFAE